MSNEKYDLLNKRLLDYLPIGHGGSVPQDSDASIASCTALISSLSPKEKTTFLNSTFNYDYGAGITESCSALEYILGRSKVLAKTLLKDFEKEDVELDYNGNNILHLLLKQPNWPASEILSVLEDLRKKLGDEIVGKLFQEKDFEGNTAAHLIAQNSKNRNPEANLTLMRFGLKLAQNSCKYLNRAGLLPVDLTEDQALKTLFFKHGTPPLEFSNVTVKWTTDAAQAFAKNETKRDELPPESVVLDKAQQKAMEKRQALKGKLQTMSLEELHASVKAFPHAVKKRVGWELIQRNAKTVFASAKERQARQLKMDIDGHQIGAIQPLSDDYRFIVHACSSFTKLRELANGNPSFFATADSVSCSLIDNEHPWAGQLAIVLNVPPEAILATFHTDANFSNHRAYIEGILRTQAEGNLLEDERFSGSSRVPAYPGQLKVPTKSVSGALNRSDQLETVEEIFRNTGRRDVHGYNEITVAGGGILKDKHPVPIGLVINKDYLDMLMMKKSHSSTENELLDILAGAKIPILILKPRLNKVQNLFREPIDKQIEYIPMVFRELMEQYRILNIQRTRMLDNKMASEFDEIAISELKRNLLTLIELATSIKLISDSSSILEQIERFENPQASSEQSLAARKTLVPTPEAEHSVVVHIGTQLEKVKDLLQTEREGLEKKASTLENPQPSSEKSLVFSTTLAPTPEAAPITAKQREQIAHLLQTDREGLKKRASASELEHLKTTLAPLSRGVSPPNIEDLLKYRIDIAMQAENEVCHPKPSKEEKTLREQEVEVEATKMLQNNKKTITSISVENFIIDSSLDSLYSEEELSKVKIREWVSERIDENHLQKTAYDFAEKQIKRRKKLGLPKS